MQVWSRGLKDVETLTQAFPLPFLAAGFSGTWEGEDLALFKKTKKENKILSHWRCEIDNSVELVNQL